MTRPKLNLTRKQLAEFLTDQESIKQFEKLFSVADAVDTVNIVNVELDSGNGLTAVNEISAELQSMRQNADINVSGLSAKIEQAISLIREFEKRAELAVLPQYDLEAIKTQLALLSLAPISGGASGSFTAGSGETITVHNGLITSIE
jgi:hypothetical protein